MSSLARWSYANTATVRPFLGEDQFDGGTLYGDPYEIRCTWAAKAEQRRDGKGAEFVTRHLIWTEDARPKYRDQITIAGELPAEIRSRTNWDMSPFGEPDSPDFELGGVIMPAKGFDKTRRGIKRALDDVAGPLTEATLTKVLIIGAGYAANLTPIATSNLVNSQYRIVARVAGGTQGRVGYTAAYAAAVHNASGKLDGQPRSPASMGNYWDPDAEPEFLKKGFERDGASAIMRTVKESMRK